MTTRRVGALTLPMDLAFAGRLICPNCGDTKFGSSQQPNGELVRHCHGHVNDEQPCAFTWPQSDDDKYFFVPVSFALQSGLTP